MKKMLIVLCCASLLLFGIKLTAQQNEPAPSLSNVRGSLVAQSPVPDPDYIALLKKRVEVARLRFEIARDRTESGLGQSITQAEAELALAEAEYALKKANEPRTLNEPRTSESGSNILTALQGERQRLIVQTQNLQKTIRQRTIEAAMASGMENGESLKRDVALEETKLVGMQARRTAAKERLENPGQIPRALIAQLAPELAQLNTEKQGYLLQRDSMAKSLAKPDEDPRIKNIDRQIKEIDDKIEKFDDLNGNKRQAIQDAFRAQEELNIFMLEQDIRAQEILVETLRKKYKEQLEENAKRASNRLDAQFDQTQLDRTNKTLERIDQRILDLKSAP